TTAPGTPRVPAATTERIARTAACDPARAASAGHSAETAGSQPGADDSTPPWTRQRRTLAARTPTPRPTMSAATTPAEPTSSPSTHRSAATDTEQRCSMGRVAPHGVLETHACDLGLDFRAYHLEASPQHIGLRVDELDVRAAPELEEIAPDPVGLLRGFEAALGSTRGGARFLRSQ